jgi:hypothetical protein
MATISPRSGQRRRARPAFRVRQCDRHLDGFLLLQSRLNARPRDVAQQEFDAPYHLDEHAFPDLIPLLNSKVQGAAPLPPGAIQSPRSNHK